MTYAEAWVSEMWRPVPEYGRRQREIDDAAREMAAEKRRVARAARQAEPNTEMKRSA